MKSRIWEAYTERVKIELEETKKHHDTLEVGVHYLFTFLIYVGLPLIFAIASALMAISHFKMPTTLSGVSVFLSCTLIAGFILYEGVNWFGTYLKER